MARGVRSKRYQAYRKRVWELTEQHHPRLAWPITRHHHAPINVCFNRGHSAERCASIENVSYLSWERNVALGTQPDRIGRENLKRWADEDQQTNEVQP